MERSQAIDLLIATAGAVLGAAIMYGAAFGIRWTRKSREDAARIRAEEISQWGKSDALGRQQITNVYLFAVLRYFIIGSCVTTTGTLFSDFDLPDRYAAPFDAVGLAFFLWAVAKLVRYMQLSRRS